MQDFYSCYSKLHLQFQVSFNIIAPFRNPEMKMLCHFDPHSRLGAAIKPPPLSNGHTTKLNFYSASHRRAFPQNFGGLETSGQPSDHVALTLPKSAQRRGWP